MFWKILVILILMVAFIQSSILFNPLDNTTINIHSPKFLHTSQRTWNAFTVPIFPAGATEKDMASCTTLNSQVPLKGFATIVIPQAGCDVETHAEVAKKAGVSAVFIIGGKLPDYLATTKYNNNRYNQSVPILFISTDDFLKIIGEITKNSKVTTSFIPVLITVTENENVWIKMTGGGGIIFYQIFLEVILIITLIVGIRAQILFAMQQGLKPTAAQLSLIFINLSLILNIIFTFDPYSVRRWYVYSFYITMNFMSSAFVSISCLSLAYFFQELLISKKMSYPGLSYFKIPFIITSFALLGIFISFSVVFSINRTTTPYIRAASLVPAAIFFILVIFLTVGGFKVVSSMKKFKKRTIGRVAFTVFLSAFGMLISGIALIVNAILQPPSHKSLLAFFIILTIAQLLVSVPLVFTFRHPDGISSSKTMTNMTSRNNSQLKEEISDKEFDSDLNFKSTVHKSDEN